MFPFYLYPLKRSESRMFSYISRGYKKGTLGRNGYKGFFIIANQVWKRKIYCCGFLIYPQRYLAQCLVNMVLLLKKKLYGPFLWMGFNCLKARATSRRQFTFYHLSDTSFNANKIYAKIFKREPWKKNVFD